MQREALNAPERRGKDASRLYVYQDEDSGNFGFLEAFGDAVLGGVTNLDVGQLGLALGSVLGSRITSNTFGQIVASGTLSTVLGAVGEFIDVNLLDGAPSTAILNKGVESFGDTLLSNIEGAGIGALSSYLTAELVKAVGLTGVPGEVANSLGGAAVSQIIYNSLHIGDKFIVNVNGVDVVKTRELFSQVGPTLIASAAASYLGSKLGRAIYSPETVGGQIGSAVGSAYGSFVGANILAVSGLNPVTFAAAVAVVAIFTVVGGLIGSVFGGTPRSGADASWDAAKNEFVVANVYSRKGGSKDAAQSLANAASGNFNAVLTASGATLLDPGAVQTGNYGMRKKDYVYRPGSTRDKDAITARFEGRNGALELINHGTYLGLSSMIGQMAGGDVFVKRAIAASLANAGGNPKSNQAGAAGTFDMIVLAGDMSVAGDYAKYLENPVAINALIAADPQTAFAAGWLVTFARAAELGLNRRGATDWTGGYAVFLDEAIDGRIGGETLNAAQLEAGIDPTTGLRYWSVSNNQGEFVGFVEDTIEVGSLTKIEGTAGNDTITFVHSASDAAGMPVLNGVDRLNRTTVGLTINGVLRNSTNDTALTIDVAATIDAGAGNDWVVGGDMGSNVLGGDGDDILIGGKLDDWQFGGAGNDRLHAGKFDTANGTVALALASDGGDGNYLDGGAGNDAVIGARGSDWLEGGDGEDELFGGEGDDILAGGAGAGDDLYGGQGNDQYLLRIGDGADVAEDQANDAPAADPRFSGDAIHQRFANIASGALPRNWLGDAPGVRNGAITGGEDAIVLGQGIEIGDIRLLRSPATSTGPDTSPTPGADLIVQVMTINTAGAEVPSNTELHVKNWFTDPFKRVEWLKFADGNEVRIGDIQTFIAGGPGDDILNGTEGHDFVWGGGGNDTIRLLGGNDIGNGGTGNDGVWGDQGRDLVIGGLGNDMLFGGTENDVVSGDAGDDELEGNEGDDVVSGGLGNDVIAGGAGRDTIKFSRGDGHDIVIAEVTSETLASDPDFWVVVEDAVTFLNSRELEDGGPQLRFNTATRTLYRYSGVVAQTTIDSRDTIEFTPGINIQDLVLSKVGRNLVISVSEENAELSVAAAADDKVTVKDWYSSAEAGRWDSSRAVGQFAFYQTGVLDVVADQTTLIAGSDGNDSQLVGTDGKDWITGGAGDDVVSGGAGDDILAGNSGFDTIRGGAGSDVLYGGNADDVLEGGAGADVLIGGENSDTASYVGSQGVRASLSRAETNTGDAAGDRYHALENLSGGAGNDFLEGDTNQNILHGGSGTDVLRGGQGDDTYLWTVGDGADEVGEGEYIEVFAANGELNPGFEKRVESRQSGSTYYHSLLIYYSGGLIYRAGDYSPDPSYRPRPLSWPSDGWIAASGFVRANSGQVSRLRTDTSLEGGQDALELGEGIGLGELDFIRSGNDLRIVRFGVPDESVHIRGQGLVASRVETLQLHDGLSANLSNLVIGADGGTGDDLVVGTGATDRIGGAGGNDVVSGRGGDDDLYGDAGDDVLEGGAGADRLFGGTHSDGSNRPPSWGDTVRYASSTAVDVDLRRTGGQLGGDAQGDVLAEFENIAGSLTGADTLVGDDKDNRLFGLGGNDILEGLSGNDVLVGEAGDDTLRGGSGDDNLDGGDGNDRLFGESGRDSLFGGSGDDTLESGTRDGAAPDVVGDTLFGGDGADTLSGARGSDKLYGDDGNDILWGGVGADALTGGAGNDTLYGQNDDDVLNGGNGNDYLAAGSENDELNGDDGNDVLFGEQGNDALRGGLGNDTLGGGDGDDLLEGGAGNDVIDGGAGNDTVSYEDALAGVGVNLLLGEQQNTGHGLDQLTNIERLTGSAFADQLEGDDFANTLVGGGGNDLMGGRSGDDRLNGNAGSDTLYGDAGQDVLDGGADDDFVSGGDGSDIVGGNTGDDRAEGNVGNDTLYGDAGQDVLDGGSDDDFVSGGDGNDIVGGNTGDDRVEGNHGNDALYGDAGQDILDGGTDDDFVSGGEGNDVAGGNTGNDRVEGNSGNDTLYGDAGDDVLDGGIGADEVSGGVGDDIYKFQRDDGSDTIREAGAGTDTLQFGAGITAADVAVSRTMDGAGFILSIVGTNDRVVLERTVVDEANRIERVVFANGTVRTHADLLAISSSANTRLAPVILDLDGDGIEFTSFVNSSVRFDMDGDGDLDRTGWVGKDDGLLVFDRNGNGLADNASEISFQSLVPGAQSDLEGLTFFDDNEDGFLAQGDSEFGRFRVWRDANVDGATQLGELVTLEEAGIAAISLTPRPTGFEALSSENWVYAYADFTRVDGTTGLVGDVVLAYERNGSGLLNDTSRPSSLAALEGQLHPLTARQPELQMQSQQFGRKSGKYQLITQGGFVALSLAGQSEPTDPRAGYVAPASMLSFSDRAVGYLTPIILDLDGDGIELVSSKKSKARFDMNGDGLRDDTGWIGKGDGLLVIDLDSDGQITTAAELSLLTLKPDAKNSLEALAVLDSNRNGKVDSQDARFGDLKVWVDRNRNGISEEGELASLGDHGIASVELAQLATSTKVKVGQNTLVATSSFTRTDGSTGSVGDAAFAFNSRGTSGRGGVINFVDSIADPVRSRDAERIEGTNRRILERLEFQSIDQTSDLERLRSEKFNEVRSGHQYGSMVDSIREREAINLLGSAESSARATLDNESASSADAIEPAVLSEHLLRTLVSLRREGSMTRSIVDRTHVPGGVDPFDYFQAPRELHGVLPQPHDLSGAYSKFEICRDLPMPVSSDYKVDSYNLPASLVRADEDVSESSAGEPITAPPLRLAQMIQDMASFGPRSGEVDWSSRRQAANSHFDYFAG